MTTMYIYEREITNGLMLKSAKYLNREFHDAYIIPPSMFYNLIKVSKFQKGILMSSNPPKKKNFFFFNISSLAYNSIYSAGYKLEK